MSPISLLLNVLWIVFGGLYMAVGWLFATVIMALTIVGLPWARAAFNIASYALLPFGRKAVSRSEYLGTDDLGTGAFGVIGNIIWLVLAGWWLALLHLVTAFCLAITIIGIPFAWAHLKLAGVALWPVGKMIVEADDGNAPARCPAASHRLHLTGSSFRRGVVRAEFILFDDTKSANRQLSDVQGINPRLLDCHASYREASDRQRPNRERAKCHRPYRQRHYTDRDI